MITVKLYSSLRKDRGKEVMFSYTEELTVRDIVSELNIPIEEISIIILDGYDNIPDVMLDRKPNESSLIHLFPPMAGG